MFTAKKSFLLFMLEIPFAGRQIDGVWHTAVVVFGREYFFGSQGITSCAPVSMTSHISCENISRRA
jgi:hypothetical protein